MEKYGVDQQNDDFEKQAQELIKTGKAKDIKDARNKVQLQSGENIREGSGGDPRNDPE